MAGFDEKRRKRKTSFALEYLLADQLKIRKPAFKVGVETVILVNMPIQDFEKKNTILAQSGDL